MHDEAFHIKRIERNRDKLLARRDELIQQIHTVFDKVTREGGISLREANVIDDYGTDEQRVQARLLDTDTHWSQVDVEQLDPGCSCMSFVDPIGYRYYAPAYMVYILKYGYSNVFGGSFVDSNIFEFYFFGLNPSQHDSPELIEHIRKKYVLFTVEERVCIARFLALDAELYTFDYSDHSLQAIKCEWGKHLPDDELSHLKSIWPDAFH